VHRPVPAEFMDRAVAESRKLPASVWRSLMAGMLSTDPAVALGKSKIPTLIFWGEHDAVCSRSEQDALVAMLPGARLEVYAGTGHAPHWEEPERVARDLERFMSS
jgi:pimeloyl-ACP methyl ester carboxylesterase